MLKKYGPTGVCPGCAAAAAGRGGVLHLEDYNRRIMKCMTQDPELLVSRCGMC